MGHLVITTEALPVIDNDTFVASFSADTAPWQGTHSQWQTARDLYERDPLTAESPFLTVLLMQRELGEPTTEALLNRYRADQDEHREAFHLPGGDMPDLAWYPERKHQPIPLHHAAAFHKLEPNLSVTANLDVPAEPQHATSPDETPAIIEQDPPTQIPPSPKVEYLDKEVQAVQQSFQDELPTASILERVRVALRDLDEKRSVVAVVPTVTVSDPSPKADNPVFAFTESTPETKEITDAVTQKQPDTDAYLLERVLSGLRSIPEYATAPGVQIEAEKQAYAYPRRAVRFILESLGLTMRRVVDEENRLVRAKDGGVQREIVDLKGQRIIEVDLPVTVQPGTQNHEQVRLRNEQYNKAASGVMGRLAIKLSSVLRIGRQ